MIRLVLDMFGVTVFAISGALAGGRKQLDIVGVLVLGIVTGVGGGTLRDLLLGRDQVFWIAEPMYIVVCLLAAGLTFVYVWTGRPSRKALREALLHADALGLAFFAVSGTQIAETLGHGGLIAVLMGTMTGVAGGAIRDVLAAEIPLVMRQGELYATAAAAGASLYLLLIAGGVPRLFAEGAGMFLVVLLRFGAMHWKLGVPVIRIVPEDDIVNQPKPGGSDSP